MKKGNLVAALAFAALAAFIIWQSDSFPAGKKGVPGPAVFPVATAVVMLMASLSLAITALAMKRESDRKLNLGRPDCVRVYICMGILVAYVFLVQEVGFCVTSSLLLFGLIKWFGKYRFHVCALSAIAVSGLLYFVFSHVLNVPFRFGFLI